MNRFSRWLLVLVGVVLCLYPFLWMFLSSFKTNREIYQPLLFPIPMTGEHMLPCSVVNIFPSSPLSQLLGLVLRTSIFSHPGIRRGGFCIGQISFEMGGVSLFLAVLLVVLPKQTLAVSMFEWLSLFGWHGSLWSLILPGAVTGLGVIFFLQLFRNLPDEWLEIAKIEGLSPLRSFQLLLPLAFPGLVTFFCSILC